MSNYTKTTDFEAKDSLPSGDSGKIIRGSEFETEFDNIATAIATKADAASPTFTGTVTIDGLTVNGNTTLGNAATDTVTVTADIASNLIPSADDTYNLGASGAEWNDLYVDGVAYIDTIDGFATTGDVTFGDNDKAIFGAGSDLQIFHDGSNSYISDAGTGDLQIKGTNLYLKGANNETFMYAVENGPVRLYHDNSQKLITTSTGIDVTGTLVSDGLTVNSGATNIVASFESTDTTAEITIADTFSSSRILNNNSGLTFYTGGDASSTGTNADLALRLASNGDISFYEDTGTTAKLFWDASAESLGIGTSSPSTTYSLDATKPMRVSSASPAYELQETDATNQRWSVFGLGGNLTFRDVTNNVYAMTLESSTGNVGIGTSSPSYVLDLQNATGGALARFKDSDSSYNGIVIAGDTAAGWIGNNSITTGEGIYYQNSLNAMRMYTNGSERMRIDSSGNVGIGTTSPASALQVVQTGTSEIQAKSTTGYATLRTDSAVGGGSGLRLSKAGTEKVRIEIPPNEDVLGIRMLGVEAMRIDANGNVGIGTSLPGNFNSDAERLVVGDGAGNDGITVYSSSTGRGSLFFADSDSGSAAYSGYVQYNHSTDNMVFGTDSGTKVTLNSSGHFLVGKSVTSLGTAGIALNASGAIYGTVDNERVLLVNRETSDGSIAEFRKDNGVVGSIGANATRLYIASSDTGLRFVNDDIRATNGSGTDVDGTKDLGDPTSRFKDLYLSGGAYLGGIASANKLDDYEEGTFTVTTASDATGVIGNETGTYTKIGDLVFIDIAFNVSTNFTSNTIGGLPFNAVVATTSSSVRPMQVMINNAIGTARYQNGQSTLKFLDASGNVVNPSTTDSVFRISGVYRAS